ncbi:MAG: glutamate-5-semialdehyde dehydrogenase [Bacteroidales bacterium]
MNDKDITRVIITLAELLIKNSQSIIEQNKRDLNSLQTKDKTLIDRLKIDRKKILKMVDSLHLICELGYPQNKIIYEFAHPIGLKVINKTVPFGSVLIIYESRPDVTVEAAAVAFKAGNRVLLKGGSEASFSNLYLSERWSTALSMCNQDTGFVRYLNYDRAETLRLIKEEEIKIDLIIPRGSKELLNFVKKNSSIPIIASGRGNNFIYIHSHCDFKLATDVILDGKRRISVCNALDKILLDQNLPDLDLKIDALIKSLVKNKIEVLDWSFIDKNTPGCEFDQYLKLLDEEFLSSKILITTVAGPEDAVSIINRFSGGHSATIITEDSRVAETFLDQTDCAAVYHNASTRFTDGGEFGMGAEIAISTQKLHSRGPLGIDQLVTNKWFIFGNGQTRN